MTKAEKLAHEWLDLFETKTTKPFNNKAFLAKYNEIEKARAALNEAGQAKFKALIDKRVKELLRPSEPVKRALNTATWR